MTLTGKLFIVSTPIGNLDDMPPRAVDCLRSVSAIACEDTRRTGLLCSRFGFKNRYISYNDINASRRVDGIVNLLAEGGDVALVSDAGTPGVSDPAYRLVTAAIAADIDIVAIPGPSALLAALVVSGFALDRFVFEGFLPRKGAKRRNQLLSLKDERRTIVLYESPHRICDLLERIRDDLDDRDVSVSRELTKLHEETLRGKASDVLDRLDEHRRRGEFTVVIRGMEKE